MNVILPAPLSERLLGRLSFERVPLFKATYHRDERLELSIRATTAKDVGDAVALSGQVFVHKTQNKLSAQVQIISVWYFESHMLRPADSSRASNDN